jgi:hypothetical protein
MINNVPEIGNRSANAKTGMIKEQLDQKQYSKHVVEHVFGGS